jgi:thioredoxin-related protein
MKFLLGILLLSTISFTDWHNDLNEAKEIARKEHRYIILNFSGSDWCGPCIQMHKEIFENSVFTQMADTSLVLMNADFPRLKKNQLPAKQQALNNKLADLYNPQGNFPFTLLLNADGKVLKEWNGFPNMSAEAFTRQVKAIIEGGR